MEAGFQLRFWAQNSAYEPKTLGCLLNATLVKITIKKKKVEPRDNLFTT